MNVPPIARALLLFCAALALCVAAQQDVCAQAPADSVLPQVLATPAVPPQQPAASPDPAQSPASAPQPPQNGSAPALPAPQDSAAAPPAVSTTDPQTFFPHTESAWWFLGGQANGVLQWHERFPAKYSGPHSLQPSPQTANSRVETLYTGLQVNSRLEFLFDVEDATGHGLSSTLGVAGFPDLDAVRASGISDKPYFARMMLRWIIPLSDAREPAGRNYLGLARELPRRRLEVRLGKFGMVDFFDANSVGTDSHLQFLGWAIDNNAAYDYAADTHGYTYGLLVEYYQPGLVLRYAEVLEPKVANGNDIDFNITQAHAENFEAEIHHHLLRKHEGIVRLLSYVNHADMGDYRQAINAYLAGLTSAPDVVATRRQGRIKYGFGANLDQSLPAGFRVFARYGWNNGATESWAYTEADRALDFGADHDGARWHRPHDRAGLAFDVLGISRDHRQYLADGGLGFLLGDGALTYGHERSLEFYYTTHIWRGAYLAFDIQRITDPGYNQVRGPVVVPGVRLHLEF
ncbi:MAG TPA: carbohydrate porin [Candidatus Acidoferrales bacterium]|nr:carbohydrate porin [Candidatus Acidoferrales bacterium]